MTLRVAPPVAPGGGSELAGPAPLEAPVPLTLHPLAITGVMELRPRVHRDGRGRFVKPFHAPTFRANGLACDFAETFYTTSRRGVLRGMHLQLPPHDHEKLVFCASGEVLDVVVDLRVGSPTYGAHATCLLGDESGNVLYVPRGVAHGFYALSDDALLVYQVTTPHSPAHDGGVRWDSAGVDWPDSDPVISPRDHALPTLAEFRSPFRFGDAAHR